MKSQKMPALIGYNHPVVKPQGKYTFDIESIDGSERFAITVFSSSFRRAFDVVDRELESCDMRQTHIATYRLTDHIGLAGDLPY
jgi:hypothetical protein